MFRYRRYRVFVVLAVFAVAALYHFSFLSNWRDATASSVESLRSLSDQRKSSVGTDQEPGGPAIIKIDKTSASPSSTAEGKAKEASRTSAAVKEDGETEQATGSTLSSGSGTTATPHSLPEPTDITGYNDGTFGMGGKGRHEAGPPLSNSPPIHWSRMPDHFPVPSESIIPLPTGKPLSIPKIQFTFEEESNEERVVRESRLGEIKEAFEHSWAGYKKHAWLQDELVPVNGSARNPFCSWGATLVDALDTLWIMGMEEEFTDATNAVRQIDFTTSPRNDIPVFETTIRYLGGLLSAYDLSGGKYKVLLEKAIELADILMGSFDTPNRMPITYYYWKPTFASNPHRAGTRTVMAELGSLSVEFTRLAQLTGEDRYYDAVAQITDELEKMQSETKLPGLWPKIIDASGCKKPTTSSAPIAHSLSNGPTDEEAVSNETPVKVAEAAAATPEATNVATANKDQVGQQKMRIKGWDNPAESAESIKLLPVQESQSNPLEKSEPAGRSEMLGKSRIQGWRSPIEPEQSSGSESTKETQSTVSEGTVEKLKVKRQLALDSLDQNSQSVPDETDPDQSVVVKNPAPEKVDCQPQGLASPPGSTRETFTFGGMADSTYEYLPKQFLLLGGLVPQYRKMYEKAIDVANKRLIFRPMIPDDKRDILVLGSMHITEINGTMRRIREPEQSHLTCFAGAMWGIGAKIFGRDADLDIASKLTDGCVWAYETTKTGIMPEGMMMLPCASRDSCSWNQTRWYEALDPHRATREQSQRQMKQAELQRAAEAALEGNARSPVEPDPDAPSETSPENGEMPTSGPIARRQLGSIDKDAELAKPTDEKSEKPLLQIEKSIAEGEKSMVENEDDEEIEEVAEEIPKYNPYPTHEEYVEGRLRMEKLPEGVPVITRREYILRPEAIESVFVMYRITGDKAWREKGWRMFQAIQNETRTEWGYSAIKDVTATGSKKIKKKNKSDSMESFWLGETLKYFYLLFSSPDLVSLDEYVLNTEAHPFKRPR